MNLAVVCLQGLDPSIVFDELADELGTLSGLVRRGAHGTIGSTHPPDPTPAWSTLFTGRNPGSHGITGETTREVKQTRQGRQAGYGEIAVSSVDVDEPTLWEIAGQAGREVAVVGAPGSFPLDPVNGVVVAGTPAASPEVAYTHPPELDEEIGGQIDEAFFHPPDPERGREACLERARRTLDQRFDVAEHVARNRSCELFLAVVPGLDRLQQAAWSTHDPDHPIHEAGDEDAVAAAYRHADERLGDLVDALGEDTAILVVSHAGAQAGRGAFFLNDWLRREGYLALAGAPEEPRAFDPRLVDWSGTRAWARGGSVGRLHLNVAGREPEGTVDPLDYEELRDEIRDGLEAGVGDVRTRVLKPREVHRGPRVDEGPDLLCSFDGLARRCEASLGHEAIACGPQRGRDEGAPTRQGSFVLADPEERYSGRVEELELLDGAPTALELLEVPLPEALEGRVLQPDGSLSTP